MGLRWWRWWWKKRIRRLQAIWECSHQWKLGSVSKLQRECCSLGHPQLQGRRRPNVKGYNYLNRSILQHLQNLIYWFWGIAIAISSYNWSYLFVNKMLPTFQGRLLYLFRGPCSSICYEYWWLCMPIFSWNCKAHHLGLKQWIEKPAKKL